jgi:hypothetical protein
VPGLQHRPPRAPRLPGRASPQRLPLRCPACPYALAALAALLAASPLPAAFYKLTDSRSQITSYVFDEVRATVPRMPLDNVFTGGGCLRSCQLLSASK